MSETKAKYLIVNADDFGLSAGVNRGIVAAHERGIVTSASLMVRQPAAEEAAAYAKTNPRLGVGLHLDLGEWYAEADGKWKALYEFADLKSQSAAKQEFISQLRSFRELTGRNPTHIDSHQHVHKTDPVAYIAREFGKSLRIPVRHFNPIVRYCGDFYGRGEKDISCAERITPAGLVKIIENLMPGVTELCCHPGEDDGLKTSYRQERRQEVIALTDPSVRAAIDAAGIKLCTFADFPKPPSTQPKWLQAVQKVLFAGR